MDEYKSIIFYYDYERENRIRGTERIRGFVSRVYKSEIPNYILHAFNGLRYFWFRRDNRYFNPDGYHNFVEGARDLETLNQAFDTFFDHTSIQLGYNYVKAPGEYRDMSDEEVLDEVIQDWGANFYISYTGNVQDGYLLKYGFETRDEDGDMDVYNIRELINLYEKLENIGFRDLERTLSNVNFESFDEEIFPLTSEEIISLFDNGELLTLEEIQNINRKCVECVRRDNP